MKVTSTLAWTILGKSVFFSLFLTLCSPDKAVFGQTPVTAYFSHFTNATSALSYTGTGATGTAASGLTGNTYTYLFGTSTQPSNNIEILDSFTALGFNYHFQPQSYTVKFRRVDNASVTGLRKALWFQYNTSVQTSSVIALVPSYEDSLERLFTARIFNVGLDNNFQNATASGGSPTDNNNIERVDVIFPSGITATTDLTKLGFSVFDRGPAGAHDPFIIAAIQSLDASGNPLTYFPALTVNTGNYGNMSATSIPYNVLRKNASDANLLLETVLASQQRDGVFISFSALSIPSFTTKVYGYSIFSPDWNGNGNNNMVNYAGFPTNTNLGAPGGLDQVAVAGVVVTNASYIVLAESLESFGVASQAGGKVQVDWKLNAADDPAKVVLERSRDGVAFSGIQTLYGLSALQQTVYDEQPFPGLNYYRLQWVDKDGVASYGRVATIMVNEGDALTGLRIYPVPSGNGHFTLEATGLKDEIYSLRLFDMSGRFVFREDLPGPAWSHQQISLPRGLAKGVYILQLYDSRGQKLVSGKALVE
jgi:hypothetical protein